MEKRTDSWHHLQEHTIPPPAEVFDNLRRLLEPDAGDAAFHRLGAHSIPPPAHLRAAITGTATVGGRSRIYFIYGVAAACVLLFTIGFVIYRNGRGHDESSARNKSRTQHSITPMDTSSRSLVTAHSETPDAPPAGIPDSANAPAIQLSSLALGLDGARFALTDNSLLATFTGYHYPAMGNHLNNKHETSLHIRLDQYTSINLSPVMTATLRNLYATRPDGSPDRKARKTREKLEKWDGEDKKQFDLRYNVNPLDPVDLAEFLYPPLFSFGRHSGESVASTGPAAPAPAAPAASSSAAPASARPASTAPTSPAASGPLTVSYTLTLLNKKTTIGIAETYNGGIQTLFDAGEHARLRLASLMRIQSIFMSPGGASLTIVTESTKPHNSVTLTASQWSHYNNKYAGAARDLADDTVSILGYRCKKALIRLHDGRRISVWYTPRIQTPAQDRLEPAFAGIPGLVLRYDYTCRRKTIRYTATSLSRQPIDASVFSLPATR